MMSYVNAIIDGDSPFMSDLMPSVAAHLGVSGYARDSFSLPDVRRYVVVMIDGLGWDNTIRACQDLAYVPMVIGDAAKAVIHAPTTTAASLMSFWTGLAPGQHGVVGFSFEVAPDQARFAPKYPWITTPLFLTSPLDTVKSVMDRLVEAGVEMTYVIPEEHISSGFTRMGTRQARMIAIPAQAAPGPDPVSLVAQAARRGGRAVVYVYDSRLDHAGHHFGVASSAWRRALSQIDDFLERLRDRLDDDVCLVVTGDHGMVDVAPAERIVIETDPGLARDLRLIGGEARFRHLYTASPAAVIDRWRARLGDAAQVLSRRQVVESGLIGPVEQSHLARVGDVVVVPSGGQAYLTSSFPGEFSLVGMHGAATAAERYVPVLID